MVQREKQREAQTQAQAQAPRQKETEKQTQTQRQRGYYYEDDDDSYGHKKRKPNPCLPPEGKTYLTIGQDLFSVQEYLEEQYNASLHWYMNRMKAEAASSSAKSKTKKRKHHSSSSSLLSSSSSSQQRLPVPIRDDAVPAAVMVYTDIQTLRGLDQPVDYGSGIEYADGLLRMVSPPHTYLDVGLQVGLWLNGTAGCRDILDGKLDDKIDELVHYLGSRCQASTVFLRIGYEFDNPDFHYASDPKAYRDAFRYMVEKCHRHTSCRRRVLAVWHSWAAGLPSGTKLSSFYPGDDVVDWVGVSLFQQFYPNDVGGTVRDLQYVLEFASKHDKPTMIAESTPFGGIHNNTITKNANNMWEAWFQPTLNFIDRYNISMWSYINCNWNVQPLWKTANFGDTRISIDNEVMELWLQEVVSNPRFIFATDDELCGNAPYPHHYRYDYSFDDDFQYSDKHNHNTYHAYDDYHYRDDDFFSSSNRHDGQGLVDGDNAKNKSHNDNSSNSKGSWWLWGERRGVQNSDGLWNAVLPLVMLSSSLAIIIFFYMTKKRGGRLSQRLQRTPRARRVRFAQLDDQEDDDDQAVRQALYGGTGTGVHEHHHHHHHYHYGSITDSHHNKEQPPHWKRSVRRIGPNLVVTNTADGTTVTV